MVLISYSSRVSGSVTSEWVRDKILGFAEAGVHVEVVTSGLNPSYASHGFRSTEAPSLSWRDHSEERRQLKKDSPLDSRKIFILKSRAWQIVSLVFGVLFDLFFKLAVGSHSDGKWSWFFTATPVALYRAWRLKDAVIFSTGGPSSAHLVGLVTARILGRRFYCEAQDPLVGSEMVLSSRASRALLGFERSLAKYSEKLVFVTKSAVESARSRTPEMSIKFQAVYPGAFNFGIIPAVHRPDNGQIVLTHLGHLYGSRNLDLLFMAIDQMTASGEWPRDLVYVRNIGPAHVWNNSAYLARSDYWETPLTNRIDGLRLASHTHFLLLVQHSDSRSQETIPYKTYDYFNLGIPIVALINNSELAKLIEGRGFIGSSVDLETTKQALRSMLAFHKSQDTNTAQLQPPLFDYRSQLMQIFE